MARAVSRKPSAGLSTHSTTERRYACSMSFPRWPLRRGPSQAPSRELVRTLNRIGADSEIATTNDHGTGLLDVSLSLAGQNCILPTGDLTASGAAGISELPADLQRPLGALSQRDRIEHARLLR